MRFGACSDGLAKPSIEIGARIKRFDCFGDRVLWTRIAAIGDQSAKLLGDRSFKGDGEI